VCFRAANIEIDSVNSVALNDQPQDPHPRLLVAANIGINTTGNSIVARYGLPVGGLVYK